jgi:predicted acyltransferase
MDRNIKPVQEQNRILSIDFFRGFTMFFLVTGIGTLFNGMIDAGKGGPVIELIGRQFRHGEWFELYFWDLIQPFFMFIVGVAMPFSFEKRLAAGDSRKKIFLHALKRSFWFLVLGFMLGATDKSFSLTDVLPHLSFVYLAAFLMMNKDIKWQLAVSFAFILASDLLYRFWPVEGFNQPFTPDHNFGSWFDLATVGHLHPRHWVTFNFIPTTAHTIWGVIIGKILMKEWSQHKKIRVILAAGIAGLVSGYSLSFFIPVIERICTSTYVIVTGAWAITGMGLSYWLIDVMNFRKGVRFFAIVGMNPIFIYIFSNLGGKQLLTRMARPFTYRLFIWSNELIINMVTIIVVTGMVWYICYFLYKRKIFIKI